VETHCSAGQATDENMMYIACWIPKATNACLKYVMLLFHCNSSCTNFPECYVAYIARLVECLIINSRVKSVDVHGKFDARELVLF
jgi:hypothetical protein